jgi:asparagine synthase (glutamine-hydrolysing)
MGRTGPHGAWAQQGNRTAVVDGAFCNRYELPRASNDAERLLMLFERHGFEGALNRLCGDFAVALYDDTGQTLWLGRDRAGIRPCYFVEWEHGVAFASRPHVLLRLPGVPRAVNPKFAALFAASHYRTLDNDPFASPYQTIRQLPAAHWARIRRGEIEVQRWWRLSEAPDFEAGEDMLAEQYRELLFKAVRERLDLFQKPAFALSGGMDSSSILASAVHLTGIQQDAFSTVYDDPTFDESREIASMLDVAVRQWHPVRIGRIDLFGLIRDMVAAHGEPVATATWLSHWLLCRTASQSGFDALFGGLGGDELNAGEYEYFFFHFADLRAAGRDDALSREIDGWMRHHDHPIWRKNRAVAEEALARWVDPKIQGRCLANRARIERYAKALRPGVFELTRFEPEMEHPFASFLKNRTWQDISREAAPCCLRAEDRHANAFGLINVDPFYDHRLMEFMFRVPGTLKIRDGVTKILLRCAMRDVLPEETRQRIKKTGWNAPAHIWFTGTQADALRDMVRSAGFKAAEFYDVREVLRLLDEHCAIVASRQPLENHMMFFWQLINLETWLTQLKGMQ